ncbi:PTS cellobiose transporter subunit IIB [Lysinibacillus odysseyi 34hs-1 = NBRC 100172]|uniref:PTS cellobiose transporter subunit IIB n=1 Tax=Lysinibacillus odysseyi 34hs-1 = NBRC 100172 TaxID=1220589 RepID=A0A0A3IDD1_9BACI|nr:PTS sugar transporter subunit IIB [Lysinibacillus odysseyi]KGR81490.1 PTS cellobiose transporter subunit IIB [Lysinibacillus odysseyi 34hs-1 = NBRC 100172]
MKEICKGVFSLKNIVLVCVAGMSTSLLVTKMQKAAQEQNIEADIYAIAESEVDKVVTSKKVDVLLLGPQVRYLKGTYEAKYRHLNIPVETINMTDYGMMKGENVLKQALQLIG